MAVTPTGSYGKALSNVRDLIANTTAFQTWTGTANAGAAAARVHLCAASPTATRPFAVVRWGGLLSMRKVAYGFYQDGGVVNVHFEAAHGEDAQDNPLGMSDAEITFCNDVQGIVDGMVVLAANGTYMMPDEISLTDVGHSDTSQGESDAYWLAFVDVTWGGGQ